MSKRCCPALGEMESSVETARELVLLSRQRQQQRGAVGYAHHDARQVALTRARRGRVFECKTCGRCFPTFQALGGHRASHRRTTRPRVHVVGGRAGAARLCRLGLQPMDAHGGTARPRGVDGCPVRGVEFAVGHMRQHRATADADSDAHGAGEATSAEADSAGGECTSGICLDLHLTPSENCVKCVTRNAGLGAAVQSVQRTLLFGCSI